MFWVGEGLGGKEVLKSFFDFIAGWMSWFVSFFFSGMVLVFGVLKVIKSQGFMMMMMMMMMMIGLGGVTQKWVGMIQMVQVSGAHSSPPSGQLQKRCQKTSKQELQLFNILSDLGDL